MEKYAFATEEEKMSAVLGMSESRYEELGQAAIKTAVAAYLTSNEINTPGDALEMLINEALPTGVVEAMTLGWMYGCAETKTKGLVQKMAKMIK